jgi:hypothetical protein
MPPAATLKTPVLLVCGEDEFGVKQRAREIFQKWSEEIGGADHEIIDASVSHAGDALKSVAKLRAALQTLPFLAAAKSSGCATAIFWAKNAPPPRGM